ncbi:MAG: metallophosphoesterase family protein [Chloroflexota bacterium]
MPVYIIGDIHGHLIKLIELLISAKLIDDERRWIGGTSRLWFMGDFFDRGPHGIGVVDLVMRLQTQAADEGGAVRALLGNHEILFMAAQRFPRMRKFMLNWKRNGGQDADLSLVNARQLAWLRSLPALALVENRLLMHADAMFYFAYGSSVAEINENFSALLRDEETDEWEQLLDDFSERMAFSGSQVRGLANAARYLDSFGGQQIIHGHTPIQYVADTIIPIQPHIYANNLCINVDGGIYLGGTGFVYQLPE